MRRPTLQLLGNTKAFVEFVLAFILVSRLSAPTRPPVASGGCLTRHSHYARVRLGGLTIWRIQCTTCKAVFTVLPHFVLRYRKMRPEVARDALLATHGGLSLEWCAVICHISPMALYRLVCALGQQSLVTVLTRCGLPLPVYLLADEKHSRCLTDKVYLPTIVRGRVLWHLGYSDSKSAAAFTESYGAYQRAALQQEPSYQVRGALTDGFDSTTRSMKTLFPGARLGNCLRHALNKLPDKLVGLAAPVRQGLRSQFHTVFHRCRQRTSLRVVALGQRLRRFADHIATTVGPDHGERVRSWFQAKKTGWYTVLADPQMPAMSTVLDQAHNAIDRKLFMMKGFHHPGGSQPAFLTGRSRTSGLRIMFRNCSQVPWVMSTSRPSALETRFQDLFLPAWPASEHISAVQRYDPPLPPLLRPSAAEATVARGTSTLLAGSRHDQ